MAERSCGKSALAATSTETKVTKETTGTQKLKLDRQMTMQVVEALWFPEGTSEMNKLARAASALLLVRGIKPEDDIERMLATQMVGTHSAAMECLRRAMIQGQTFEGRDQNLRHGAKLLSIYARQMDALNKHRGKGQQKVTVEHVHVEAGGQAVVGHVETAQKPSSRSQSNDAPKAIAHVPGKTLDLNNRARLPTKQRDK